MGIRYFSDYTKSNEIILDEKLKINQKIKEDLIIATVKIIILSIMTEKVLKILRKSELFNPKVIHKNKVRGS